MRTRVFTPQELLLQCGQESQCDPEQDLGALVEERVEHTGGGLRGQRGAEEAEEPGGGWEGQLSHRRGRGTWRWVGGPAES